MIGPENRQSLARDIHMAHQGGAQLRQASKTAGIDMRILQRWKASEDLVSGDRRSDALCARTARIP